MSWLALLVLLSWLLHQGLIAPLQHGLEPLVAGSWAWWLLLAGGAWLLAG